MRGEALSLAERPLLLVVNPASSSAHSPASADAIPDLLSVAGLGGIDEYYTEKDPQKNATGLKSKMRYGQLICAKTGDKTLGQTASAMVDYVVEQPTDQDLVLLPIAAGHKNDFARSIGNLGCAPSDIIRAGTISPVHLIEAEITTPDGQMFTERAINTAGLGGSAIISYMSSMPGYRQMAREGNKLSEAREDLKIAYSAVRNLKRFDITTPGATTPQPRYEITLVNSRSVGGRGKVPVEASDPRFYHIELASRRLLTVGKLLSGLLRDALPEAPEHYLETTEELSFTLDNPRGVMVNFDGDVLKDGDEPWKLPKGTQFTFRHSRPINVLQMKPPLTVAA